MKRFAIVLVFAGCTTSAPEAKAHVTWGGQNGIEYEDNVMPSTRKGPPVACPDWGSQDGPAISVIAEVDHESPFVFDCHDGSATFDVPAGSGTIEMSEGLAGVSVSRTTWKQPYSLAADEMLDLGYLDLDFDVSPAGSPGGGCEDDCGGDPFPF